MLKKSFMDFFSYLSPFCSNQTSPLDVPLYAFGYPLQASLATVQFDYSDSFFPIPEQTGLYFYSPVLFFYFSVFSFTGSCTISIATNMTAHPII